MLRRHPADPPAPRSAGPFQLCEIRYGAAVHQQRHAHPGSSITLVLAGRVRERVGAREEIGSALSVVIKPAGVEHEDEFGCDGARTFQLAFDLAALGDVRAVIPTALDEWRWLHARPAAAVMLTLLRLVRASAAAPALEDAAVDALALLPDVPAPAASPPGWLQRVRQAVDDEVDRPCSIRQLAASEGVHPVSLSRAFRRYYGSTLTEHRRRERLRRAASAIGDSHRSLSYVAIEAGYADHPHLCREFRTVAGMSPSTYRRLAPG